MGLRIDVLCTGSDILIACLRACLPLAGEAVCSYNSCVIKVRTVPASNDYMMHPPTRTSVTTALAVPVECYFINETNHKRASAKESYVDEDSKLSRSTSKTLITKERLLLLQVSSLSLLMIASKKNQPSSSKEAAPDDCTDSDGVEVSLEHLREK